MSKVLESIVDAIGNTPLVRLDRLTKAYGWREPSEAKQTARELAVHEGIFGGFSSGANVAAALRLLAGEMRGKTIAVLICDSGLKYLSTDLWE